MLDECKRILLCNGAHLGDLILSTAVLPVLKSALPKAKIGFLIGSWSLPVIEHHSGVEWIHVFDHPRLNRSAQHPKEKKKRGNHTWHQAIYEIQQNNYDLAIDLYYFYKANSGLLLSKAKVPHRIGFWASPSYYTYTKRLFWDHAPLHMVENHGCMLKGLGIDTVHLAHLAPMLQYKNVIPLPFFPYEKKHYLLVHVGVGEPKRQWNVPAWQRLLSQLSTAGYPLVILGHGKRERELITQITAHLQHPPFNLCDQLSWRQLLPLVENARLLVGLESMGGHVAAAMGTPAVVIYGRRLNVPCWRPYHPNCRVVTVADSIASRAKSAHSRFSAIHTIRPEDVFQAVLEALSTAM